MKKLLSIVLGLSLSIALAATAMAGPSRAIVQELGATVAAGEVNIDLNVIPLDVSGALNVANRPATVGGGDATVGGATISSVNIGLGNGFEVRTGALPGLFGQLSLANARVSPMGVTLKYSGFVPGLAVYGGIGSADSTALGGGAAPARSANGIGAAYTTSLSGFVLNGNVQIGNGTAGTTSSSSTEYAVAALYPVTANILVGGEYLNSSSTSAGSTTTVSGFALGGRAILGNFTVDAAIYSNVTVGVTGLTNGTATQMGNPMLVRVNYKF